MTAHSFKQTLLCGVVAAALAASTGAHAQDPTPQARTTARDAAETARDAQQTARDAAAEARTAARVSQDDERREMDQLRTQMRELSRKMADLSAKVGDVGPREYAWRYIGDPERGMVGVVLDSTDQGLRVSAVTPGGAADKAGIRNNDIIVAVNGKPVDKKDHSPRATSLGDLKVDESITLSVQRDGKTHDYALKAERRDPYNMAYAFSDDGNPQFFKRGVLPPDFDKRINEQTERAMAKAQQAYAKAGMNMKSLGNLRVFAPWWGLNLTTLNPDLGSYFGSDKGVLVLSAEDDEFKQLKSGDVLKQVAGKQVERPEDAFRLLREQPAGSEVKVDVLRQHKPLTLTLRAPDSSSVFVIPPPPPAPPTPPALPAAPAAPAAPAPPAPPTPPAHMTTTLSAMPVIALSIDDDAADSEADDNDEADEGDDG